MAETVYKFTATLVIPQLNEPLEQNIRSEGYVSFLEHSFQEKLKAMTPRLVLQKGHEEVVVEGDWDNVSVDMTIDE